MAIASDTALYSEALVVLGAAAVVIPLAHRLRVSPVLGFILLGVALGPFGSGMLTMRVPWLARANLPDAETIAPLAELGVVMLMFMIGLELSFERLAMMRRLVFGLGTVQLAGSALAIGAVAAAFGRGAGAAAVFGLALAMSSTAIVLQVLGDERRLNGPVGRASIAVLLFQDIAVVPVTFAITLLGHRAEDGGMAELGLAIGQAVLAIVLVLGLGRLALRPLFREVARTRSPETFMAACLLVVIATGMATAAAGMSMTMGALIAGLLLAETEYRRQIEVTIEPFKGLLVGVFLISVGMGLDLRRVESSPGLVILGVVSLVLLKLVLVAVPARAFGIRWGSGLQAGLLLGPGGEFGFVIIALAQGLGLIDDADADLALILAAVTMTCIPLLSLAGRRLAGGMVRRQEAADPIPAIPELDAGPRVILAGCGRVGQTVMAMLQAHSVPFVAVDSDPDRVAAQRRDGHPVYWGDITRIEFLRRLHIDTARALVVTLNDRGAADRLVVAARAERPDLLIVARAHDATHAAHLYGIGATDAVPETIEASLQLSEAVLVDLGVPMGPVIASIHERREKMQEQIKAAAPHARVRRLGRRRVRDVLRKTPK